jgi:hypothetical protein
LLGAMQRDRPEYKKARYFLIWTISAKNFNGECISDHSNYL